jgi:cobalt-zinc-cadmium efflux system membrane fusion protein
MITGYVRKINFIVGESVNKGQIMAELESMEFIDLQQKYIELQARTRYLKVELDRQKLLREQDAVSKKKYLMAEVDYLTATSTLDGLKSKLTLLGLNFNNLNLGKIESGYLLKAPISGSVVMQNTMIGKHVDPSEEIYKIVDPEHLHLELNVYEKDVIKLRKEQKVIFKIPSLRKTAFHGEVFLIGKDLSEDKRSINVHVHLNENEAEFKVGMYAIATIEIAENQSSSLPVAAVVQDGTNKYIFIKTETQSGRLSFNKSHVITGVESEGFVEILNKNDLSADEDIVIEGAFYLLAAFSGTE